MTTHPNPPHPKNRFSKRVVTAGLAGFLLSCLSACQPTQGLVRNPKLQTIRPGFPGNAQHDGRFTGDYASQIARTPWPIIRWKLSRNPKAVAKRQDTFMLPVKTVASLPAANRDYLIWLGHATFLIHVNGRMIITDPCLGAPPFFKRLSPAPLKIKSVPLDYVLVSHGHYDHFDKQTLAAMTGQPLALVPLGLGRMVADANPRIAAQEAGWYQMYDIPGEVQIILLPAKHWNRRTPWDFNHYLWGSYLIRWKDKTLYFGGDSGYDSHFREIAATVGPVDYALLPIAAYDPPFIMKTNHMNPEEALQAFKDLGARRLIPMHYGTFDLSDEPLGEPLRWLQRSVSEQRLDDRVLPIMVGEPLYLD